MIGRKKSVIETQKLDVTIEPSMRNANTKMIRFWHFHTDKSRAGPTRLQKYLAKREPKILRTSIPSHPPPYTISSQWKAVKPEIASMTLRTANEIEQFLENCYKTKSSFKYKKGSIDILKLLSNTKTVALLLKNPEGQLCGTVISSEQPGLFHFRDEISQPTPRLIQYLCIHPMLRGRGLAGWLLAWLDKITHQTYGPCVHLGWWFAPPPRIWSPLPSIVQVKLYKKILPEHTVREYEKTGVEQITAKAASRVLDELLSEKVNDWLKTSYDTYLGLHNIPSNQTVHWWKYTDESLHGCSVLVGIVCTDLEAPEGTIWQVVYCGYVRSRPGNPDDISMPFWDTSHIYNKIPNMVIELILAAQGVRVALISDIPTHYGGGLAPSKWSGWSKIPERSKLILYNWMPPSFGFEDCLWIAPTL